MGLLIQLQDIILNTNLRPPGGRVNQSCRICLIVASSVNSAMNLYRMKNKKISLCGWLEYVSEVDNWWLVEHKQIKTCSKQKIKEMLRALGTAQTEESPGLTAEENSLNFHWIKVWQTGWMDG